MIGGARNPDLRVKWDGRDRGVKGRRMADRALETGPLGRTLLTSEKIITWRPLCGTPER